MSYLHKPLLALERNSVQVSDWPPFVAEVAESEQEVILVFSFLSSTKAARDAARARVLESPTEIAHLERLNLDPSRVHVDPWPTRAIRVELRHRLRPNEVLAAGEGVPLDDKPQSIRVPIAVPAAGVSQLKQYLSAGDVFLRIFLQWRAVSTESASIEIVSKEKAVSAAEAVLVSQHGGGSRPLVRDQREALEQTLAAEISIRRVGTATAAEYLSGKLVDSVLHEPEWLDYEALDDETKRALGKALEPLVNTTTSVITDDLTKTRETVNRGRLTTSFPIQVVKIGTEGELTDTWKRAHGIELKETSEENTYAAYRIELSKVRENWRQSLAAGIETVTLITGASSDFELEANLSTNYTVDALERFMAGEEPQEASLATVPLGAMLCYFGSGQTPPAGYQWADGQGAWPRDAGWLRAELRGGTLPDMRSRLVGGAETSTDVGQLWNDGVLVLPKPTTTEDKSIKQTDGSRRSRRHGHLVLTRESGYVHVRDGGPDPEEGTLVPLNTSVPTFAFPEEERTMKIGPEANPPHVRCRWIVRTH